MPDLHCELEGASSSRPPVPPSRCCEKYGNATGAGAFEAGWLRRAGDGRNKMSPVIVSQIRSGVHLKNQRLETIKFHSIQTSRMTESTKQFRIKNGVKLRVAGGRKYILKLFVSGIMQNSVRAIKNINKICKEHLKDNYELEIIDIYQQPELAISEQIIVIPVMIIKYPLPERRLIGDLSDVDKILEILNIK